MMNKEIVKIRVHSLEEKLMAVKSWYRELIKKSIRAYKDLCPFQDNVTWRAS